MISKDQDSQISQSDVKLYDRQIRLWGMESQAKLQKSNILIIGMCGTGAEIAKNIILAGVHSITVADFEKVSNEDISANFLIDFTNSIGKNCADASADRLQALNPRVCVTTLTPDNNASFNVPASDGSYRLECPASHRDNHGKPVDTVAGVFAALNATNRAPTLSSNNGVGDNANITPPNNGRLPDNVPDDDAMSPVAGDQQQPVYMEMTPPPQTTDDAVSPPSAPVAFTPNVFPFDTVIDCTGDAAHMLQMNALCRRISATRSEPVNYVASCCFGYYGFVFSDLGHNHEYVYEEKVPETKSNPKEKKIEKNVTKKLEVENFCTFQEVLTSDWSKKLTRIKRNSKDIFLNIQTCLQFVGEYSRRMRCASRERDSCHLREIYRENSEKFKIPKSDDSFISKTFGELSPVCAIVGGIAAQEIIKAITKKDRPHNNWVLYDGVSGATIVDKIDQH